MPALPSADGPELRCSRCGQGVDTPRPESSDTLPPYDSWEWDQQLRHVERLLHGGRARNEDSGTTVGACQFRRLDSLHASPPARHTSETRRPTKRPTAEEVGRESGASVLTWLALSLGTATLVCGGILLGWSLATDRQELWNVGLPTALAGQIALLVGLVLQLDRIWHDNRKAAAKLDNVDVQLHDLKTSATLLGVSHGPASSAFYSHLAGGAGPQLLLTDLKSQLDLLAMKIAQESR